MFSLIESINLQFGHIPRYMSKDGHRIFTGKTATQWKSNKEQKQKMKSADKKWPQKRVTDKPNEI